MARRIRSAGMIAACCAALFALGCQGGGAGASAPAIISGSPADPVAQPPLAAGAASEKPAAAAPGAAGGGSIVVSASPSIDISPADVSVTVDASSVNLRRVFEDLGPDAQIWYQHVQTLANPFFEGRGPESRGAAFAADYLEYWFRQYRLEPAFPAPDASSTTVDEAEPADAPREPPPVPAADVAWVSYRQPFVYAARGETHVDVKVAEMSVNGRVLEEGKDFVVLGNSGSASVTAPITFVGYAIDKGPEGYTSFGEDANLAGRAALMLRGSPRNEAGGPLWSDSDSQRQGRIMRKMRNLAERGVAAVLLVNPPGTPQAGEPLESLDTSRRFGRALNVPVVQVTPEIASEIVTRGDPEGRDLLAWRKGADSGQVRTVNLADAKMVSVRTELDRTSVSKELHGQNVAGALRGRGALADQWIAISGHWDHVGMGDHGGIDPRNRGQLHPGADDNASGTAGVLVLAERLAKAYADAPADAELRSILFLAFDAEEMGLRGSRHFTNHLTVPADRIVLAMNMDMIGRLRSQTVQVLGTGTGHGLEEILEPHFHESGLTVNVSAAASGRSDEANFHRIGVPGLHFYTGMHPEYHAPGDHAYTVNPAGAIEVLDLMFDIAMDLAGRHETLVFEQVQRGPGSDRGYGRVRLGIRPGMGDEVTTGIYIEDVSEGTSADDAGMLAGDVIVRWNNVPLDDLAELFEQLQASEPGDKVTLTVLREGQPIELDLTLKASGGG